MTKLLRSCDKRLEIRCNYFGFVVGYQQMAHAGARVLYEPYSATYDGRCATPQTAV